MSYRILENRLIAYLDVLGFTKSFLAKHSLEESYNVFSSFMDKARTEIFYNNQNTNNPAENFEYANFLSDSIVLVSKDISDISNVSNFIGAVTYLMKSGFIVNLPLRGAITVGDFLIDSERDLFLSKEFANLVKYEGTQEWAGCCILKEAEDLVLNSLYGITDKQQLKCEQFANNAVLYYPVPLKQKQENLLIINFMIYISKNDREKYLDYLIDDKRKHTYEYANFVTNLPCEIQMLSPEFKPAVAVTCVKTRSGFNCIFFDENKNQCQPGIKEFQWVVQGY